MVKTLKYLLILNQKANGFGTWYITLGCGPNQICTNDESRLALTYFMARSNLIPNALFGEKLEMFIFLKGLFQKQKKPVGGRRHFFSYPTTHGIQIPRTPTTHVIRKLRTPTTHRILIFLRPSGVKFPICSLALVKVGLDT